MIYYWPAGFNFYYLLEEQHPFEWANDAIKPKRNGKGKGDVYGCGLLLNSMNKLAIFFTLNGILMGQSREANIVFNLICLIFRQTNSN
jgi:hypothetical protein